MDHSTLIFPLLVFLVGSVTAATPPRPNIVVFIADDHSQADSQPYGSTEVRTPQMARLAAEGMKFTHAFVASPSCGPSRTALLTGLWSARNGAEPNHKPKNPGVASLPPVLKSPTTPSRKITASTPSQAPTSDSPRLPPSPHFWPTVIVPNRSAFSSARATRTRFGAPTAPTIPRP